MQINISSLEDLAVCLKSGRLSLKLTVLQKVYKQLEHANTCGKKLQQPLIDLIYERYEETDDKEERTWCTCILLLTEDDRKFTIAEQQFFAHDDNAILLLCADQITSLPASRRATMLSNLVMKNGSAARQRLTANLLSDCLAMLEPDVALRVAILSDHQLPLKEVTDNTLGLWIKELSGPYRMNVRRLLGKNSQASFSVLLENWKILPTALASWVITKAIQKEVDITKRVVMEILETSRDIGLQIHALGALNQLPFTECDEAILESLYGHKDNSVSAAALEVGRNELPWDSWLAEGVPDDLRLAVLKRITKNEHKTSMPFLEKLLQDKNWKIRARTTETLIALAPDSLNILKAQLRGDHLEARIGAVQALQRLGEEKWVLEATA